MALKVGMVYDLRKDYLAEGYSEEEVAEFDSEETIAALEGALRELGHRPERIGHARALCGQLAAGRRWDLVFNVAEGLRGRSREAQAPCLLEMFDVPYTFSDPLVCALTLDKAMTKRVIGSAGLATPSFAVVRRAEEIAEVTLELPLFAKPVAEGTGKGISDRSVVETPAELRDVCTWLLERFRQPVLVEEYLPGREFTTAVLGTGERARVLGTMEIVVRPGGGKAVYSYEKKERCEELIEYKPVERGALRGEAEALALAAYRALECRDAGRVDVRCDGRGRPGFVEINPLPGLHPTHSDLPMIATQEGVSYVELIGYIVQSARQRTREGHAVSSPGSL